MSDANKPPITHVFVLMLENHSFDNILGASGLPGIESPLGKSNVYDGKTYFVKVHAPEHMCTDPGHEFADVLEQLCGYGAAYEQGGKYSTIHNSGFASNYATSKTEPPHTTPPKDRIGDIMRCFDTPSQLPVIYHLASEFAVCDRWFSSIPGPTWPNRFFVHGASSAGFYDSPKLWSDELKWWTVNGFEYPNGSIFDALTKAKVKWRLYIDDKNQFSRHPERSLFGFIPQVAALKGIQLWGVESFSHFADDVCRVDADGTSRYPYQYTFIEPNWGESLFDTYKYGSAQHPMDGVHGGEALVKATYEAIRKSVLWDSSLLIVTYDEHGGFYDHVPPPAAPAPNDHPRLPPNKHQTLNFTFEQYGARVPAIVISPLIPKLPNGLVDHTTYDHTSILATLERLFGLDPLTDRDRLANDLLHLTSLPKPRLCPKVLNDPAPLNVADMAPMTDAEQERIDQQSLSGVGTRAGLLLVLRKAEVALSTLVSSDEIAALPKFLDMKTLGDARRYSGAVATLLEDFRATRMGK